MQDKQNNQQVVNLLNCMFVKHAAYEDKKMNV